jgi:hypothetical protein
MNNMANIQPNSGAAMGSRVSALIPRSHGIRSLKGLRA